MDKVPSSYTGARAAQPLDLRNAMDGRIYLSGWSVDPLGWRPYAQPALGEPVTLEPASRDAALQFSTFLKNGSEVTEEDIRSFASEEGDIDAACAVSYGPFQGLLLTKLHETRWWRHWWLRLGRIHLYVTYNADIGVASRDHLFVNELLSTLRGNSDEA